MISNGLQLRSVPSRQRNQSIRYSYAFFLIGTYLILACWSFSKSAQVINHPPRLVKAAYGSSQHVLSPSNAVANVTKQRDYFSFENSTLRSAGTFVIQVRGEMGNNLQRIAYGHALKWYAEDEFQFSPQLLLRHLKKPKWRIARGDIYQCFPLLRSLDYEEALQPKFVRVQKGNHPWLAQQTKEWVDHLSLVKDESLRNISLGLGAMKQLAMIEHRPHPDYPILVLGGPMRNVLIDKYYQRFREALFEFDNGNGCCAQIPESDEVVFVSGGNIAIFPIVITRIS